MLRGNLRRNIIEAAKNGPGKRPNVHFSSKSLPGTTAPKQSYALSYVVSAASFTGMVCLAAYYVDTDTEMGAHLKKIPYLVNILSPIQQIMIDRELIPKKKEPTPPEPSKPPVPLPEVQEIASVTPPEFFIEEVTPEEEVLVTEITKDDNTTEEVAPVQETHSVSYEEIKLDAPPLESSKRYTEIPMVAAEQAAKLLVSHAVEDVVQDANKQTISLRKELEMSLLKDIHKLDENELRMRIAQLAAELFERISWEGIRLNQSLKQVETILGDKYSDLMRKQREQLMQEMDRILLEKEKKDFADTSAKAQELIATYESQFNSAIKAQAEGFQSTLMRELESQALEIRKDLQGQMNGQLAMVRREHDESMLELLPRIEGTYQSLKEIRSMLIENAEAIEIGKSVHNVSAVIIALEIALQSQSASKINSHIKRIEQLCSSDPLILSTLNTLPESVYQDGLLSNVQLQARFRVMREEVRKAALAPEQAPMMLGQMIGGLLASVSVAPSGYVTGPGVEEALSRAAFHLDRGDLKKCLVEIDCIAGYSAVLMTDWKKLASERLVVDQAVRVIKAHALIRHKSYA